jgi:L-2-hydroxyglutarate oxidase
MHFGIIGGGLVGLATALKLREQNASAEITVWEKEDKPGNHQSTHNSGVLHAGLYYKPGSLKARLAVAGIREMVAFCRKHGIPHDICGKLVVATAEEELPRLKTLQERGTANGLRGLEWIEGSRIREFEPHAAGIAAVRVPEEGIVDYRAVVDKMQELLIGSGVAVHTGTRILGARKESDAWRLESSRGDFQCGFLVNCAGLHSDRVAQLAGEARSARIVPFRGEYYQLRRTREGLVRNLIYPVPDPKFPFLGVHFTRLVHGGIEAGPNAVLALAREGYRKTDFNARDVLDYLTYAGLWRFAGKHLGMCWSEIMRSASRRLFCESLQRLVPDVREDDLVEGGAGVRAQAMESSGELIQDFHFVERPDCLHVINAPSPAATASLAIGGMVAEKASGLYAAGRSPYS